MVWGHATGRDEDEIVWIFNSSVFNLKYIIRKGQCYFT